MRKLKGIIFDMDGTIVDSQLNFSELRKDMNIAEDVDILEFVKGLECQEEKKRYMDIIDNHEKEGVAKASIVDGADEFLNFVRSKELSLSLLTRNSKQATEASLKKLSLNFDVVITRDDVVLDKPNPEGIFTICRRWELSPEDFIVIGDFIYDIHAAKNAGCRSILYNRLDHDFAHEADHSFECYQTLRNEFDSIMKRFEFI